MYAAYSVNSTQVIRYFQTKLNKKKCLCRLLRISPTTLIRQRFNGYCSTDLARTRQAKVTIKTKNNTESEFNEFKPRLKFAKNLFQFSAGLILETIFSGTNHI